MGCAWSPGRGRRPRLYIHPEVTPTIPEDVVGRGGVVRELEVEIPRVGIENEAFEVLG